MSSIFISEFSKVELYWVVYRKHFQIKDWKHSRMQDLKDKPSISLHTAYQVWYFCFQGKARYLQHTNFQLETLWTLQVRVVILDDGLHLATWYTMDGLNRKRYIRNPIWIESTIYINLIKPCYPHPSWYWTQRGRGVKVQNWPHILLKNNAWHRIKTIY